MDYQLGATKIVCANVGPRKNKNNKTKKQKQKQQKKKKKKKTVFESSYRWHANHRRNWSGHYWSVVINTFKTSTRSVLVLFLIAKISLCHQAPMKQWAYMNKLTTKKQMQMQTWWALVGAGSKLRSKVKFFSFLPFSRLINFVRQRRKTSKIKTWEVVHKP